MSKVKPMFALRSWLSSLIVLAIMAVPVMAANNDAKPASDNAANTTNEASPSPNPSPSPSVSLAAATSDANVAALLGVLVQKGVLAPSEANAIKAAVPGTEFQLLVEALSRKGVLSAADLSAAMNPTPSTAVSAAASDAVSTSLSPDPGSSSQASAGAQAPMKPAAPAVVPAIAPVRVLALDAPKKDGLVPAFKMGPVKMTPYGFIKATAAHDSSSPNGDDFPFIGLFTSSSATYNTGPTEDPEFHIKARATRFGTNIEWPDISSKLTLTGRIEADFEGNFSAVDNRNVSSIRSNAPQLRLAYVRMDYAASENTDFYFEGGQDWTLFGSAALPNLLETTFLGAYYGNVYERSPQMMVGFNQRLASSLKLNTAFAIMMPSTGQVEKSAGNGFNYDTPGNQTGAVNGLADQLGQGEREGADANRPEYEGKIGFQFQLDKAPGVAPAQFFWSGFYSKRNSIVTNSAYATAALPSTCFVASVPAGGPALVNPLCTFYATALPNGYQGSSKEYGNQLALQLPTRWATLVVSGYRGGDLRFMFGGQANSFVTDMAGLSGAIKFDTVDGLGNAAVACSTPVVAVVLGNGGTGHQCTGSAVVAPERPIRAFGGFINLGLPISRWFNADPKGHNAGWQLFLHAGKDQLVSRDTLNSPAHATAPGADTFNFSGQNRLSMGKIFAGTLYYKLNPYCTFAFEQSVYAAKLSPFLGSADWYTIAGVQSREWQDHRTEFGPVFTF